MEGLAPKFILFIMSRKLVPGGKIESLKPAFKFLSFLGK